MTDQVLGELSNEQLIMCTLAVILDRTIYGSDDMFSQEEHMRDLRIVAELWRRLLGELSNERLIMYALAVILDRVIYGSDDMFSQEEHMRDLRIVAELWRRLPDWAKEASPIKGTE